MKLLAPKYDVVFHALFKESTKDKLGKMISAILNREVKVLSIEQISKISKLEPKEIEKLK